MRLRQNRETFRELIGPESFRDFPPQEPPKGPKGLSDAPTGSRASSYGSDYREQGNTEAEVSAITVETSETLTRWTR